MLIVGTVIKPLLSVPHNHVCDTVTMSYCTLVKTSKKLLQILGRVGTHKHAWFRTQQNAETTNVADYFSGY